MHPLSDRLLKPGIEHVPTSHTSSNWIYLLKALLVYVPPVHLNFNNPRVKLSAILCGDSSEHADTHKPPIPNRP